MARDVFEKVHDAADAYNAAYAEQKDYSGEAPRRGHRVNVALDELKAQIDAAVAERDALPEGEDPDTDTGGGEA